MRLGYLLQASFISRWWNTFRRLFTGAWVHPAAFLLGDLSNIEIGRSGRVGAGSLINVGASGRVIIGKGVWLSKEVEIETPSLVFIGEGSTIQRRCTINGSSRLGTNCILAPNVFISSGTHPFRFISHLPIREQERRIANNPSELAKTDRPVWIQDDCWLGANTVVCPGVIIGKGSVVGANSVVTRDVLPYSVVAGVPAKKIGTRMEWHPKRSICVDKDEDLPYLLSGKIVVSEQDGLRRIEATGDVPLLLAMSLAAADESLLISWAADIPVDVEVGDGIFSLDGQKGILQIPQQFLKVQNGATYCLIRVVSVGGNSLVRFWDIRFGRNI